MPRATVGVVGFSGHGKTVYLTSLFSELSRLSAHWPGYYFRCLDDYTHRILYEQVPMFQKGQLPDSTPANFPNPSLIQYTNLPGYDTAYMGYYDTAGEVFTDADNITRAGYFVAHADAVLFIMSIPDCEMERMDEELSRLLDTYIRAVYDHLKADLKQYQELVVIFSKADLVDTLPEQLRDWLYSGRMGYYLGDPIEAMVELNYTSMAIETWLTEDMRCNRFVNMANSYFKEVRYCLVSATGLAGVEENRVVGELEPLRVLDPFYWLLHFCVRQPVATKPQKQRTKSFWQKLWSKN